MRSKKKIAAFVALIVMTALLLTACGGTSAIGMDNSYGRVVGLIVLGTDDITNKAVEAFKTLGTTKGWDIETFKPEVKIEAITGVITELYTTLYKKDASGQNGQNASMLVVAGGDNTLSNQIVKLVNDTNYTNFKEKGSKVALAAFFIGTTPDDPATGTLQADFDSKVKLKDFEIKAAPHGYVSTAGVTVGQLPGDLCYQQIVYAFGTNVAFKRDNGTYNDAIRKLTVSPEDVSKNVPAAASTWDTQTYMKERVKNTFQWELINYYR